MAKNLLRVLVSVVFIALFIYAVRDDIPTIIHALKNVNRPLTIVSILIFLSTVLILSRRLQLIFAAEDVPIKLRETSNLTFVGYFFNNFLPTSVGGDIVKAICASKVTRQPVKSVTSVLMDRIFGLSTFIVIPALSLCFILDKITNPYVPMLVYSFLAFAFFCFFMLFNRSLARRFAFVEKLLGYLHLAEKVRKIYDGLHNFKNHKGVVVQAILLSLVGQSVSIVVLYLLAMALGADANIIYFFILIPVVHLVSMAPSLGGLGIRENAYIYFLSPYIGRESAAALGILWLGLLLILSVMGGIIYLVRHDYHFKMKEVVAS
jgi:uncharacterized protein (TIRG00374 family)